MTKNRKLTGLIALAAVLMHAVLLTWHAVAMGAPKPVADAIGASIVMCHGSAEAAGAAEPANTPAQDRGSAGAACPICSGAVSALAIAPPEAARFRHAKWQPIRFGAQGSAVFVRSQRVCPPARGPPCIV